MTASICIPTLCSTEARFEKLVECVHSALQQTCDDIEVVVLDNASNLDVCGRLANRFRDERLKLYRNERTISMPENFNEAIARSTGEIVKPLCDDDLIHPDLIHGCMDAVKSRGFLRIRDVRFRDARELRWSPIYVPRLADNLGWLSKYRVVDAIAPTCTMFTRRAWEDIGRYTTSVTHVWDYVFAMEAQLRFGFNLSNAIGCGFRIWEESSTVRNPDPFRNFKEMHLLYSRNSSVSMRVAKALYVGENLARSLRHPDRLGEVVAATRKYVR